MKNENENENEWKVETTRNKVLPWIIYKRKQINWIDIAFQKNIKKEQKCVRKNMKKKSDYFFFVKKKKNFTIVIYEKRKKICWEFSFFFIRKKK